MSKSDPESQPISYEQTDVRPPEEWTAGNWWTAISWSFSTVVVLAVPLGYAAIRWQATSRRAQGLTQNEGNPLAYLFMTQVAVLASLMMFVGSLVAALANPKDRAYWNALVAWAVAALVALIPIVVVVLRR
ncbi:MAG TPA: hypothetical protein VF796_23130 [Humisphaera sp.]